MSQQTATIESLPMAFEFVKAMRADDLEWGEGYRQLDREALAEIIEERMSEAVERWLEGLGCDDPPDRRNGFYHRHLLTELGDIEIAVPRTWRYSPCEVLRAYARLSPGVRPGDPGRLRSGAFDPQGGRGAARHSRPEGEPHDGEPGGPDAGRGGPSLPPPGA